MANELDDLFSTNESAEENGVWVDVSPKIKMKIRAFSAKAVTDLREQLTKPFRAMLRAGAEIPEAQDKEIGRKVIAGAVIADWKGFTDAEGVEVRYSAEEAFAALTRLPKMANFVIGISTDNAFYKEALEDDGAKN